MTPRRRDGRDAFDDRLDALSWMRMPRECAARARWWGSDISFAITGPIAPAWLQTLRWALVLTVPLPYGGIVDDVVIPCHARVCERQPHLLRVQLIPRCGRILTYLRRRVAMSTAGHADVLSNIAGILVASPVEHRTLRNRLRIPDPAASADGRDREHH